MLSIDEFEELANEMYDEIPERFLEGLSGGIIVVPAIWTWVTTTQRAQAVRRMAADGPTEVPSLFLGVLLGFIWATNHPYLQSSLNATWRMAGATRLAATGAPSEQAP